MKRVFAMILLTALLLCACAPAAETGLQVEDGELLGSGSRSFTLVIEDAEGKSVQVTVRTEQETVGKALQEVRLVEGEQGDYGLFIQTVAGVTADYEKNGQYWAFFVNGEYAQQSADLTPIEEGAVYMLKVEAA